MDDGDEDHALAEAANRLDARRAQAARQGQAHIGGHLRVAGALAQIRDVVRGQLVERLAGQFVDHRHVNLETIEDAFTALAGLRLGRLGVDVGHRLDVAGRRGGVSTIQPASTSSAKPKSVLL